MATEGGSELKDIVVAYCLPINSGFDWTVESIAIKPRPRVIFSAKELIEKKIEFIVSDTTDLEILQGLSFILVIRIVIGLINKSL